MPRQSTTPKTTTRREKAPTPQASAPAAPASGFTIERPQSWEGMVFDKATLPQLPPEGDYDATIHAIRLIDKTDTLWMAVEYRLADHFEAPEPDFAAIAARPGSPHGARVPDGARMLYRLATAAGVELAQHPDPFEFPAVFEGKKVRLRLAHKTKDGVPALVVRRVSPKA